MGEAGGGVISSSASPSRPLLRAHGMHSVGAPAAAHGTRDHTAWGLALRHQVRCQTASSFKKYILDKGMELQTNHKLRGS